MVLGIKEGLVECATVCVKSVVILLFIVHIIYVVGAYGDFETGHLHFIADALTSFNHELNSIPPSPSVTT